VTGSSGAFDPRDVVTRKRDGLELRPEELRAFVLAYGRGEIADHVAAAFLMAVYLRGLSPTETAVMTSAMIASGSTLPLSGVTRPKVDKHSTGGVSDGVTLVFAPLAASLGLAVAKLSGRGLGHTGGTLDKLESIPGVRTSLTPEEVERQVERVGCVVAGPSADLVPADGAMYALREATATIESIPLIAASVMSKKLAVGTDLILLDVKAGSGAFMKTPAAADELAEACVRLAAAHGRAARVAVTDMSQPLGSAIGNALEVAEAVAVLQGRDRGPLRSLSVAFAAAAADALLPDGSGGAALAERALELAHQLRLPNPQRRVTPGEEDLPSLAWLVAVSGGHRSNDGTARSEGRLRGVHPDRLQQPHPEQQRDHRGTAVRDERERDAGHRHDPRHHPDVHRDLEQEQAGETGGDARPDRGDAGHHPDRRDEPEEVRDDAG